MSARTSAVRDLLGLNVVTASRLAHAIKGSTTQGCYHEWTDAEVTWAWTARRLQAATRFGPADAALRTQPIVEHPEASWLVLDNGKPILATNDAAAVLEAYRGACGVVTVVRVP